MPNEYKHTGVGVRADKAWKPSRPTPRWLLACALGGVLSPDPARADDRNFTSAGTSPARADVGADGGALAPAASSAAESPGAGLPQPSDMPRPTPAWRSPSYVAEVGLGLPAGQGPGSSVLHAKLALALGTAAFRAGVALEVVGWRSPLIRIPGAEWLLSLCPGLAAEWSFARGRARTALTMGPAILLDTGSSLGTQTEVGLFFEVRPVGILLPLGRKSRLGIDPLGVRVLMPELSAVPIFDTQFHTSLWLELTP